MLAICLIIGTIITGFIATKIGRKAILIGNEIALFATLIILGVLSQMLSKDQGNSTY